jgi:hypothetical protein
MTEDYINILKHKTDDIDEYTLRKEYLYNILNSIKPKKLQSKYPYNEYTSDKIIRTKNTLEILVKNYIDERNKFFEEKKRLEDEKKAAEGALLLNNNSSYSNTSKSLKLGGNSQITVYL